MGLDPIRCVDWLVCDPSVEGSLRCEEKRSLHKAGGMNLVGDRISCSARWVLITYKSSGLLTQRMAILDGL